MNKTSAEKEHQQKISEKISEVQKLTYSAAANRIQ
jgi:hypothetical protein